MGTGYKVLGTRYKDPTGDKVIGTGYKDLDFGYWVQDFGY